MRLIKGIAKLINYLSLYSLCYLMLAYTGSLPLLSIPGFTVELIPTLLPIVVLIGDVASLISDGLKRALLQLLIQGSVVGIGYAVSNISGIDPDLVTIFIWIPIILICIPIIIWKIKTGRTKITWR